MSARPLDQLSDREKALLRLLAEGHTVKSAASITGDSEYAANELLRSARRKLGVASSREAARALVDNESSSQKNRHRQFGVALSGRAEVERWSLITGGSIVFATLAVSAILALLSASAGSGPNEKPHEVPRVVETFPAHGAHIQPGRIELRVTFDRPMSGQISIAQPGGPNHLVQMPCGDVRQSEDRRSFIQTCQAIAGAQHTVFFGGDSIPNFVAKNGSEARPYVLSFTVAR